MWEYVKEMLMQQVTWSLLSLNVVYILIYDTLTNGQEKGSEGELHDQIDGKKLCTSIFMYWRKVGKQAVCMKVTYPMRP